MEAILLGPGSRWAPGFSKRKRLGRKLLGGTLRRNPYSHDLI